MAVFTYEARARGGAKKAGELSASSRRAAMTELIADGLQPISIEEKKAFSKKKQAAKSLTNSDVIMFTEELSELLNAGLPLEPALASMAGREESGVLKSLAENLRVQVTEGIPFSKALETVSERFDALYLNLVSAGEASGSLGSIVGAHAQYLKEQAEIRSKLMLALLYPSFLLTACLGIILIFLFYLLPQLTGLLTSVNGDEMPIGIRIANAVSGILTNYWAIILGGFVVVLITIKLLYQVEANKLWWDKQKVNLPFYGQVYRYGFFVQWLKTLSNLLSNGVSLLQSLELSNEIVQNRFYKGQLVKVVDQVKDGIKLTTAMRQADIFPANMIDLIAVGDETGEMARSVERAGQYFETKLGVIMKSLIAVITPIILIGMAIVVGALCYTMIQAIYGSIGNMGR